jgi:hypothetical protein
MRGIAGGDWMGCPDRLLRSYLIHADQWKYNSMLEQMISSPKKEEKMVKGLTTEQRRHLEKSLKENDELMRCLAEM